MEIASLCPFTVGTVLWQGHGGGWTLTTCVKGTFKLVHGREAAIADAQEAIGVDRFFTGPNSSLYAPSDIVPFKPKTDVLVVGHAYAPGGAPAEALVARFTIGDFSKSIGIVGDRIWTEGPYGLEPSPPSPFVRMPLRYERAAKGIGNPIGVDLTAPPMAGARALPNLETADDENAADVTIGCGPIPSNWIPRRGLLSPHELGWVAEGCRTPVPEGFNFGFYNAAPADQQIGMLRQGARILLENLNPEHPRLETRLPHIRPKAFLIDRATQRGSEIALRCDTLWLDTDRGLVVLVWRGLTDVNSGDVRTLGTLAVAAEMKGQDLRFKHIERLLREEGLSSAETESFTMSDANPLNMRYDGFIPPELAGSPAEQAMSQALRRTAQVSFQDGAQLPGVVIQDNHRSSSAPPPPPVSQVPRTLPSPKLGAPAAPDDDDAEGDEQNAETVTKKVSVKGVQPGLAALRASSPEHGKSSAESGESVADTVTQKLDVQRARASMASLPSVSREREKPKLSDETSSVPTSESPTLPMNQSPAPNPAAPKPGAAARSPRAPAAPAPKPAARPAPAPNPAAPRPPAAASPAARLGAPPAPRPSPSAPRPVAPAAPAPRAPTPPARVASSPQPQPPAPHRAPTPPAQAVVAPPAMHRASAPPPQAAVQPPAMHRASAPPPQDARPSTPPAAPSAPYPAAPYGHTPLPPKPAMVTAPRTTARLLSLQDYARIEASLERGDMTAVLQKFNLDPEGLDTNRAHWKDQIRASAALALLFDEALEAARWE